MHSYCITFFISNTISYININKLSIYSVFTEIVRIDFKKL